VFKDISESFSTVRLGKSLYLIKEGYKGLFIREGVEPLLSSQHSKTFHGRGTYTSIPLRDFPDKRVIVKQYRHGGLWGRLAGDILWLSHRPLRELMNTEQALQRGVSTAEVIGTRIERLLWPFYRAELFSLEVSGTEDLIEFLTRHPAEELMGLKKGLITQIAQAVRKMHDAGLYHADLHLKNILLQGLETRPRRASGGQVGDRAPTRYSPDALPSGIKVYIIDLDKSTILERLSMTKRMDNLLRLERSVEKFKAWQNCPGLISKTDKLRFLRAYLGEEGDWKPLVRRFATGHALHRFWWRLLRAMGWNLYNIPAKSP
jgi:tRNA A-37 threonylcarbamoyl transferase component Bud32